jgi:hypothetical protein
MSYINHITYEVPRYTLDDDTGLIDFFDACLGFEEMEAKDKYEHDYKVRWFRDEDGNQIHLVENSEPHMKPPMPVFPLGLGHFCVFVSPERFDYARKSRWLTRDSGSGRIWLEMGVIRAELRAALDEEEQPVSQPVSLPARSNNELEAVLREATGIFIARNRIHKDSWKREGLRGALFNARRKIERAWDGLWDWSEDHQLQSELDDLFDAINYMALAILCYREGNRDGKGGWW